MSILISSKNLTTSHMNFQLLTLTRLIDICNIKTRIFIQYDKIIFIISQTQTFYILINWLSKYFSLCVFHVGFTFINRRLMGRTQNKRLEPAQFVGKFMYAVHHDGPKFGILSNFVVPFLGPFQSRWYTKYTIYWKTLVNFNMGKWWEGETNIQTGNQWGNEAMRQWAMNLKQQMNEPIGN